MMYNEKTSNNEKRRTIMFYLTSDINQIKNNEVNLLNIVQDTKNMMLSIPTTESIRLFLGYPSSYIHNTTAQSDNNMEQLDIDLPQGLRPWHNRPQ